MKADASHTRREMVSDTVAWAAVSGGALFLVLGLAQYALALSTSSSASSGQVVLLSDLAWIVAVTIGAAAGVLLVAAFLVGRRTLVTRHAGAMHRAGIDSLTELGGHRMFREELARQAGSAARRGRPLTLVLFDVDDFAVVNAAQGLRHGEAVLAEIGAVLRSGRSEDIPFRVGGDVFAVLFPHTNAREATIAVERIRASIAGGLPGITVSAGVAELDPRVQRVDALYAQAELALRSAKRSGRDRMVVFGRPVAAAA